MICMLETGGGAFGSRSVGALPRPPLPPPGPPPPGPAPPPRASPASRATSKCSESSANRPARRSLAIHRNPQRRSSPPVPHIEISALIHQKHRDFVPLIIQSEHQRTDALRRRKIDIGSGRDQEVHAGVATGADGIHQRIQPAHRAILRARLAGHLTGPIRVQRTRLDVRAFRKQQFHDGQMAAGRGIDQRRLIVELLNPVDVRARIRPASPPSGDSRS